MLTSDDGGMGGVDVCGHQLWRCNVLLHERVRHVHVVVRVAVPDGRGHFCVNVDHVPCREYRAHDGRVGIFHIHYGQRCGEHARDERNFGRCVGADVDVAQLYRVVLGHVNRIDGVQ